MWKVALLLLPARPLGSIFSAFHNAKARQERNKEGKHSEGGYANMITENEIYPTFNCRGGNRLPNECASVNVPT